MIIAVSIIIIALLALHWLSYSFLKTKILKSHKWDLNICCGKTDGGGINVDIVKRDIPNFVKIKNIYKLPFKDKQFNKILCSHTIEHVEDPDKFFAELKRIGKEVTLVIPPLWDLGAVLDILEHKWIFLTLKTKHHTIPKRIPLPLARSIQKIFGQVMHA